MSNSNPPPAANPGGNNPAQPAAQPAQPPPAQVVQPQGSNNWPFLAGLAAVIMLIIGVKRCISRVSHQPAIATMARTSDGPASTQTRADAGASAAQEELSDDAQSPEPQQPQQPAVVAQAPQQPVGEEPVSQPVVQQPVQPPVVEPRPVQVTQQPAAVAQPATRPPPVTREGWTCPAGRVCVSGADAPNQTCDNAHRGANDGLCLRRFSMAFVRAVDIISPQHPACAPDRMCIDCRNLADRESGWSTWSREIPTRNDLGRCAVILP